MKKEYEKVLSHTSITVPLPTILYLCDVRKPDHVGHQTNHRDEDLPSTSKGSGKLVDQGRDEAFDGTELKRGGARKPHEAVHGPKFAHVSSSLTSCRYVKGA